MLKRSCLLALSLVYLNLNASIYQSQLCIIPSSEEGKEEFLFHWRIENVDESSNIKVIANPQIVCNEGQAGEIEIELDNPACTITASADILHPMDINTSVTIVENGKIVLSNNHHIDLTKQLPVYQLGPDR